MRPIDADAFNDDLDYICGAGGCLEPITSAVIKFVKERLAQQPTIKPRKGKWLPDNNSVYEMRFVCSECNESQVVPTTGFTKYKPIWNFCPNCGADMRGEQDG